MSGPADKMQLSDEVSVGLNPVVEPTYTVEYTFTDGEVYKNFGLAQKDLKNLFSNFVSDVEDVSIKITKEKP